LTEGLGYVPVPEQSMTLADGQTLTKDCIATGARPNSGRGEKQ